MPAGIAVPAIASVAGGAIGAIGQHRAQSAANRAQQQRIDRANMYAGQDYQRQLDFQNQLMGGQGVAGGLFNQLAGPQTSTSTGSSSFNQNTVTDQTSGLVKTPELLATRTRAEQAAGQVPYSLAGLLQQQFGNIAREQEGANAAARNLAASRGLDPALARAATFAGPGERNANQARLAALSGINQEAYSRAGQARQEQASIEQMLADQFQRGTSRTSGSSRSNQTNVGPGNIAAALGLLQPAQRQVYV